MLFKLRSPILIPNTVHWLTLNTLVDKVCCFLVPSVRNRVFLDLDLTTEDIITDILSCLAFVRALTHHTFISYNSYGEVISR